jgi:hypothetical protein
LNRAEVVRPIIRCRYAKRILAAKLVKIRAFDDPSYPTQIIDRSGSKPIRADRVARRF